jgi:enolase-phosphatase E1
VVTDIEGTTTPIAFVHRVLFPFARDRMKDFLARHGETDAVRAVLDAVPGEEKLATLLAWMDADAKVTQLKTLQGMIWDEGYRAGVLRAELYPGVAPLLRRWHGQGVRLAVYSSGSVAAQRLLFAHTPDGDLTPLFAAYFDTAIGAKREAASYAAIAASLGLAAEDLLFLSDVEAELDAAAANGWMTCQLARPEDGTVAGDRHPVAADFDSVSARFGLG